MTLELLSPRPDYCQICAEKHDPMQPHNAQNFYYQFLFNAQHDRCPTWNDAMSHCSKEVKEAWLKNFARIGVDPNSTNLTGNLKSQSEVNERLSKES